MLELTQMLARISAASARHADRCILAGLIAAGVAAYAIPQIVIDTDYLSFFDADSPVRRDFDAVNERLAGAIPIYVVLSGYGPGAFREPATLHTIETLKERADAIPGVSRSAAVTDTLRVMNRAIESDDPAQERIPDDRSAVTELFQLAPKERDGALLERQPVARESGGADRCGGFGGRARTRRAAPRRCCRRVAAGHHRRDDRQRDPARAQRRRHRGRTAPVGGGGGDGDLHPGHARTAFLEARRDRDDPEPAPGGDVLRRCWVWARRRSRCRPA